MEKLKICYRIFFSISLLSLIIGASFHGYRIHPENIENYNIGTTMGMVMIILFTIFLILGIIMRVVYKKHKCLEK